MSFYSRFFKTAFLGVVFDRDGYEVSLNVLKGGEHLFGETKHFGILDEDPPKLLLDYIKEIYNSYQIVYVATLLDSINQGAVPSCSKDDYKRLQINTKEAVTICVDNSWSIFASRYDLDTSKKFFEPLGGLDFVFSSFMILRELLTEQLREDAEQALLCVLKMKSSATVAVFMGGRLLYGSYVVFQYESAQEEAPEVEAKPLFDHHEEHTHDENLVDLDDMALELDDELTDLAQSGGDFGELSEMSSEEIEDMGSLGIDLQLLEFLRTTVAEFYKNPAYDSSFIEHIIVADPYGRGVEVSRLLESEMLIPCAHLHVNLSDAICELGRKEVLE